jgi:hypothetical protein
MPTKAFGSALALQASTVGSPGVAGFVTLLFATKVAVAPGVVQYVSFSTSLLYRRSVAYAYNTSVVNGERRAVCEEWSECALTLSIPSQGS